MRQPLIVYFQQNLALGATEEYLYLLLEGMDKSKFKIGFICPDDPVLSPLRERIGKLGIAVHPYSLTISNYRIIRYLCSLFHTIRPDLVHFNDPCLNGIIAARLAGVPILVMTHHTPELNRRYNVKGKILEKIAFRYCGLYVIFTSEYDRETGIKKDKISMDRSFVIYYGLPHERFIREYTKKDIYKEFSLDDNCRIIGNIARLSYQKGQKYLIEAAPLVIERFKSVKFFIVGEGELGSELKAKVRQKGLQDYFIFTGFRTDITRLLSAFEILVMPSLFEGLCFSVIEASAMGVPVVATAVGGMRRSVIDGKTGLLVSPKDSRALAEAILWMLGYPKEAREMGLAARIHFDEYFTQKRMVRDTEELYVKWIG